MNPPPAAVSVLGPLEMQVLGRGIAITGERQRRVLAALVDAGPSGSSVDQLAELVWNDADRPDDAIPHVRTAVSRLRRQIAGGGLDPTAVIESRPGGYRIGDGVEVDVWRFEDLVLGNGRSAEPRIRLAEIETALSVWRGEPFEGLDVIELAPTVARLGELRLAAEQERLAAWLDDGHITRALARASVLVEAHPWREELRRLQALALYRMGRQTEALRALDEYRRAAGDELGLEPGPALVALEQAILEHDASVGVQQEAGRALRGYRVFEVIAETSLRPSAVRRRASQASLDHDVIIESIVVESGTDSGLIPEVDARARARAELHHPHVEPLLDRWREPGSVQLVTPLFPGNLHDMLAAGPLEVGAVVRLACEIGAALQAIHDAGIVHGDIRPEAVLVDAAGYSHLGCFPPLVPRGRTRRDDVARFAAALVTALVGFASDDAEVLVGRLRGVDDAESTAAVLLGRAAGESWATPSNLVSALLRTTGLPPAVLLKGAGPEPNPYPGLAAYREAASGDFHGREGFVEELCDALRHPDRRLIVVTGASGSGKSSVVTAGLLPRLRADAVPGSRHWVVATMTPGTDPFGNLIEALGNVAIAPDANPGAVLEASRAGHQGSDVDLLAEAAASAVGRGRPLLIVVDQLEEIYAGDSVPGAGPFLDILARAVGNPHGQIRVVATLRADYFDRPLIRQPFAAAYRDAVVALAPLTPEELERAIARPAGDRGVVVDTSLQARLIADVMAEPGALPLLNLTLHELWNRRRGDVIDLEGYEQLGGLTGALVGSADEMLASLGADGVAEVRRLVGRIVAFEPDHPPRRRRARLSDVYAAGVSPETVEAVAGSRLIAIDRDPISREPTVTISHEAVITHWPRLVQWLGEDRERLHEHGRLSDAAEAWEADLRDPALLLRGTRLDRAVEIAESGANLTELENDLLQASLAERRRHLDTERRQAQRRRTLSIVASTVALVAIAAGAIALVQAGRADRATRAAEVRLLTQAALSTFDERPDVGLQLAVAAVERGGGVNAERTLIELLGRPLFDRLIGTAVDSRCIAMSPDPAAPAILSFAVADVAGRSVITRWTPATGGLVAAGSAPVGSDSRCPVASPGGDRIAFLDGRSVLLLADTATGEVLASADLLMPVRHLSWAQDGSAVAALADGGSLRLLDPLTLGPLASFELNLDFVASAAITAADGVAVVASDARPPLVVDLPTGATRELHDPDQRVSAVAVAGDFVAGRNGESVFGWSLATGALSWTSAHSGDVRGVGPLAINSTGSHLAVASREGVEIFDSSSGRRIADPVAVVDDAAVIGFAGEDELLVSGAGDRLFALTLAPRFATLHEGYEGAIAAPDGSIATYLEDGDTVRALIVGADGTVTDLGTNPLTHRAIDADTAVGFDILERRYVVWDGGEQLSAVDLTDRGPDTPDAARSIRLEHGLAVQLLQEKVESGPSDPATAHLLVFEALTGRLLLDMPAPGVQIAEPISSDAVLLGHVDHSASLVGLDGSTVHEFDAFGHGLGAASSAGNGDFLFGFGDGSIIRHEADTFRPTRTYVGPPSAVIGLLPFDGGFVSQHWDGEVVKWYDETTEPAGTVFFGEGFAGFASLSLDGSAVIIPAPGRVVQVPLSVDAFMTDACSRVGAEIDEAAWRAATGSSPEEALAVCS